MGGMEEEEQKPKKTPNKPKNLTLPQPFTHLTPKQPFPVDKKYRVNIFSIRKNHILDLYHIYIYIERAIF